MVESGTVKQSQITIFAYKMFLQYHYLICVIEYSENCQKYLYSLDLAKGLC